MSESIRIAVATDARLLKRSCESLLGIAAGLVADGELNAREIQFLSTWLSENQELAATWPGEVILKRIRSVLSDGVVTAEEAEYLKTTLTDLIGGSFSDDGAISSESTSLPIDVNAAVVIPSASFCFTGKFLYGTRAACERAIEQRGGTVATVSKKLNYLVIGELSSRDWKFSSFGTKILSAIEIKQAGANISIVSEEQWSQAL